ncbi:MAG TPA: efflux RND transporter periplasmic adaptor subunit [bacterium]|nr:efflux RND transporter periplasmic adaptor subunit [bacterium]HOH67049.1 efflux RND transporter periplasmic adaptor subunit [bacterium]HQA63705.1 efflux RND transporter periplasmic adaptor subunit [bacterium]
MKKILKRKWFWLVLVVLMVIVIIVIKVAFNGGQEITYTTEEARVGQLTQTVTATGSVESAQDISLNFKTVGKLVFLGVKEGEKVTAGKVLARIDSAGLAAQTEQYRANLYAAQADLARVKAGSSVEDIRVSQEQVAKGENDLASLKAEREIQIKILKEKILDAVNNGAFTSQVALDNIFNYFINDDKTANLIVQDNNLLSQVESNYYKLANDWQAVKNLIDQANSAKDSENIIVAADKLRTLLSDLTGLLNNCFRLAETIVINANYSQTAKDNIKLDISGQQSTNNTSLTALQTARANLTNSSNSYDSQIEAAEKNLNIYRAQLDLKQAGPRDFELSAAQARVAQAQAQLNQALANLADYSIIAPIDGTVTQVNYSIGEQTNLSAAVVKMLSTEQYQIKVDIAESDITKIKIGDKTIIKLDAFGNDQIFTGTVSFIDPAQTIIQDVIYYRTTVSFDSDSRNEQIKPGMTADVTVTTANKNDVLYIPQRAVKLREAILGEVPEKYVEVLVAGNQVVEKTVEIGLRGDDGLVEIISGLTVGDKVVTFKKNGAAN